MPFCRFFILNCRSLHAHLSRPNPSLESPQPTRAITSRKRSARERLSNLPPRLRFCRTGDDDKAFSPLRPPPTTPAAAPNSSSGSAESSMAFIQHLICKGDNARQLYGESSHEVSRLELNLEVTQVPLSVTAEEVAKYRAMMEAADARVQALHEAVAIATTQVNARGDTLAHRPCDIPNHAREIAGHGVHSGAAIALVEAQTQLGQDLRDLRPVSHASDDDREAFDELIDDLEEAVGAIAPDVVVML